MIAHSATSASASGANVAVSSPRAAPTVGTIPKNGASRNFQTAPTATGAITNGRKNTPMKNDPAPSHVGDEQGEEEPEAGLQDDRRGGEQQGVRQALMEYRVAEDRPRVVLESDEGGEREALRVVDAQDDPVDERIDQEDGQDRDRRQDEQQIDAAFASGRAAPSRSTT